MDVASRHQLCVSETGVLLQPTAKHLGKALAWVRGTAKKKSVVEKYLPQTVSRNSENKVENTEESLPASENI